MFPGRGAFGLRGRIVGAVLVTTVVTLGVAAVALLGPLEHNLRRAEFKTFRSQAAQSITATFRTINDLGAISEAYVPVTSGAGAAVPRAPAPSRRRPTATRRRRPRRAAPRATTTTTTARTTTATPVTSPNPLQVIQHNGSLVLKKVQGQERSLVTRLNATEVALLGTPTASGAEAHVYAAWPKDAEIAVDDRMDDVRAALGCGCATYSTATIDGTEFARAALPFTTYVPGPKGQPINGADHLPIRARWVLIVRRPFAEVNGAVHAVRVAFLDAAVAALVLTLLLAIPLSFTLVRRLRRLREAALQLGRGAGPVTIPGRRARDEVGDLARSFGLMQEQLRHQEEARRAFVATASHELRTPLTSLEGMLELLADDLEQPEPDLADARDLLERARAQSHRLGRLAADLLDLSRIDAQVALRSEPVELEELSRAVLAEFELGTSERGILMELHDPGRPLWALGDPGSVARILRILLDNAVRVSPPGSRITVALHPGPRAELTVCDEGPGVPPEEREQIFQRFQRGRNTSGQAGFGLGLAIGRELAERMGGELVLEDADGCGARFMLRLPTAAAPDHDALAHA